jgi:hypothetical protein
VILTSVLHFIANSLFALCAKIGFHLLKPCQLDWLLSFDIITRIIFSIIFLKIIIGRHHILSIILFILACILTGLSDLISIGSSTKNNNNYKTIIIFISIIFPKTILFPISDILNKILLTNDFLLPHSLIFWRGVIQFGIFLILIPFLYFFPITTFYFEYINNYKNLDKIIYSIIYIFTTCIRKLCMMKVIYIFNSHYVSFLLAINIFSNTLTEYFAEDSQYKDDNITRNKGKICLIADIISLILLAFGALIFNEMIIINCCHMNERTKKSIVFRERLENISNLDSVYYADEDEIEEDNITQDSNNIINNINLIDYSENDNED